MKIHRLRASTAAFALAAVAAAALAQEAGQRGIELSDMDRSADALHRLLRVRQRRLARGQSDPGLDAALEPALGGGRDVQGPAQGDPRRGLGDTNGRPRGASSS